MRAKKVIVTKEILAEATQNAFAAVREKAKEIGLGFAGDCAISWITAPVDISVYNLIQQAVGNGPHIQKYGLQEAAGNAFCETLVKHGIPARLSISLD